MYSSTRLVCGVVGTLVLGMALYAGYQALPSVRLAEASEACTTAADYSSKIDCWHDLLHDSLRENGLQRAMETFTYIYETQPLFATSGCHRHAHRIGDAVYYEQYLPVQDLDAIEFPQETTACGYGFFHGFIEHLIQDHPTISFITATCNHLTERLGDRMGDIRITCYHGAGHGLMLAQAERVPRSSWGQVVPFVQTPLKQCEALPNTTEEELEECKEGIFNILVDWMEIDEYGFTYNTEAPFALCERFKQEHQRACYYEMAQKLSGVSNYDPVVVADIVAPIAVEEHQRRSFMVGIAGIMQSVVARGPDAYMPIVERCALLTDEMFSWCVTSAVDGLFEHGLPHEEYKEALLLCQSSLIEHRSMTETCWNTIAQKLKRFYPPQKQEYVCEYFPDNYRTFCSE